MKLVQIYKCLCDETRLRILHLLSHGALCVCHFQSILDLPQVAVSKHLAYLRSKEMVIANRREQWMIYSLPAKPTPELTLQLKCLQDCVQSDPVFKKDLTRLRKIRSECNWIGEVTLEAPAKTRQHA